MREPKRVILELLLIAAVGTAAGLTANAVNPKGLQLGKDYFLSGSKTAARPNSSRPAISDSVKKSDNSLPAQTQSTPADHPPAADPAPDPYAGLSEEIRAKLEHFGLSPLRHEEVKQLFEDPLYANGLYMIIDAREDADYVAGHLPGAYHLYYYHEEQYAANVVPFVPGAEKVIVYCNGGDCEDSVLTAVLLRDKYVVDPAKIFVYPEGFEGWQKAGLPVERGERNSGDIIQDGRPAQGGK